MYFLASAEQTVHPLGRPSPNRTAILACHASSYHSSGNQTARFWHA